MAEMNEKRGAKDDRGMPTTRRLRSEKRSAMPPEFLLLSTAFVWGGYHPCMRMLLTDTSERGSAPTPSEINLARFSLVAALFVAQAICANAACFRRRARSGGASLMTTREEPFGFTRSLVSAERGEEKRRPPGETFVKLERAASLDNKNAAFLWGAACELAFWHFVTIALQSTGVAFVGATRAGFIAASTTMTVPFVSALFGESVSTNTWIAAFVSMAGAALIVFSSTTDDDARVSVGNAAFVNERFHQSKRFHNNDGSRVFLGDALTSAGSVAWAVFLFRLSRLAPRFPRLPLAVARSACMTLFVAAWWLVDTLARSRSNHAQSVSIEAYERETEGGEKPFRWLASPRAAALTAFMAIGPGWACAWWQATAQASVSAARAAVLMSTTPLWGAVWAAAAMGETMDWVGWLGGLTVVGGTVLVALDHQ